MRHIVVRRPIGSPNAPDLGTPIVVSNSALTVPLARPASGPIAIASYTLQRSTSPLFTSPATIATGLSIFGTSGYPDTQLSASTTYYYRATATDTTGRVSAPSAIVSQTTSATASDVSAPTIPRALAALSTVGAITFRCWPSCDKYDGSQVGSGVTAYRRYRNGVRVLPDIAAPSANAVGAPVLDSIGTAGATFTRQGVDWDMTAAGASGLNTTSDSIGVERMAWARGDVTSATIAGFTSPDSGTFPGQYGGAGCIVRESNAVGAKFVAIYYTFNGFIYVKWRGTTNGSISETYIVGDGIFRSLHIESLSSGTFVCYYEDASQQLQILKTTTTAEVNLATTGIAGTLLFSLTANAASAQFRQIANRPATSIDYAITTTTSELVEFEAVDVAGNVSAKSAAVTASPATAGSGLKRWNQGWYLGAREEALLGDTTRRALREEAWVALAANANLTGGVIVTTWGSLESSPGVYTFDEIDIDIARIKGMSGNRKYCLLLNVAKFDLAPPGGPDARYFPPYIFDGGYTVYNDDAFPGHGLQYINFDDSYVAGRYKLLCQAINAHIGDDDDFEMWTHPETANYGCQTLQQMVEDMGAVFQKPNVVLECNFFQYITGADLGVVMLGAKVGFGAPDLIGPPGFSYEDHGARVLQGFGVSYLYEPGDGGSFDCGTVDYRGKLPVAFEYQKLGLVPFSQVSNYARNVVRNTHMMFMWTEGEAAGTNYSDGLLPFMASVGNQLNPLAVPRPTGYG